MSRTNRDAIYAMYSCVDIRVDIPRYYQVVVEKDCVPSDAYDCKIRKPSYDGRFARY